jgi:hypothetical protein
VESRLGNLELHLHKYDPDKEAFLFSDYYYSAGWADGEPDVSVEGSKPFWITVDEFRSDYSDKIGYELKSDTFDLIDRMVEIGRGALEKLKDELSEERIGELKKLAEQHDYTLLLHKKIKKIQKRFEGVVEGVLQGKHYDKIRELKTLIRRYNELPKSKLGLVDGVFIEVPPINEQNYLSITKSDHWPRRFNVNLTFREPDLWGLRFDDDLTYCLIEFLQADGVREKLHKCNECGSYFIAKTAYKSESGLYFCKKQHRLAYHNRIRIETGKNKEYKRKKRKEGAKESYYG